MTLRRPVIAGNWKMNDGPRAARAFFESYLEIYRPRDDRTIVFFPPALSLAAVQESLRAADRSDIGVGVQNIYWEPSGAFTGEISAPIAAEAGAAFALVGHSERRHVFGETSEDTGRKLRAALDAGVVPVLCVGELLEEREAGRAAAVVEEQLAVALDGLPSERVARLLIAYEPVWAIGTGRTASPADAEEMHGRVRQWLARERGASTAAAVPILYGGSVKPENAGGLLAAGDVDGLLVGGASLDPAGFARISNASG
jgi:triosephosphate isomerase